MKYNIESLGKLVALSGLLLEKNLDICSEKQRSLHYTATEK